MRRTVLFITLIFGILLEAAGLQAQPPAAATLTQFLANDSGLVSLRVPEGWYLTADSGEDYAHLIAAPTPERAAEAAPSGDPIFHVYWDRLSEVQPEVFLTKTLKEHGLAGMRLQSRSIDIMGISGKRYEGETAAHAVIVLLNIPESHDWIRFVATASPDRWDADLVETMLQSFIILPQQAATPRGWAASIRAPLGWEQDEFSSFVTWTAPDDSPFAGTEVWFQAGFRTDLIGQGEPPFVLRSLGVTYAAQVDESAAFDTVLGGLPAQVVPFESFTHTGIAVNAQGGSDFGTANLVVRAPLGEWTPAHQQLAEAMIASVQILPPTADAAPVGLGMGYRPPNFSGTFVDGSRFSLSDYEGQLVFVHYWFVDCPYCREEWPHLQAVYDEYKDKGMVLLAINAVDPLPYIQQYMRETGLDFPIILDDGSLHDLFEVRAFPTTFVVGPDGVLVRVARGPMNERSLRNLAEQYLAQ